MRKHIGGNRIVKRIVNIFWRLFPTKVKDINQFWRWKVMWRSEFQKISQFYNKHYVYFYTTHFGLDPSFYSGKRILDIGCGPRGSLEWADMTSLRIGLDPLAKYYLKLGADKHKMKYVAAPAERIPFDDNFFDVVSSFNSLDHVEDIYATISEIKRILKPGGLFLLLTELNHDATYSEPQEFSWNIVLEFLPTLEILNEKHYEKNLEGMYQSIQQGTPYDHSDRSNRYGILSVKFQKLGI